MRWGRVGRGRVGSIEWEDSKEEEEDGLISDMAGRGGLGYGGEGKWVRGRFCAFRLDVEADGEGVFSQACGRAETEAWGWSMR